MLPAQHLPYIPRKKNKRNGAPMPPMLPCPPRQRTAGGLHANSGHRSQTRRAGSTACSLLPGARGAWVSCGPSGQGLLAAPSGWIWDQGARGVGEWRGRVWPLCSGQRAVPWHATADSQSHRVFLEKLPVAIPGCSLTHPAPAALRPVAAPPCSTQCGWDPRCRARDPPQGSCMCPWVCSAEGTGGCGAVPFPVVMGPCSWS